MSWFFWFYVLPFVLTLIMLPKCSASNVGDRLPNYNNPVLVKNVLLAFIVGSIPLVNIGSVFVCGWMFISNYQELFDSDFFNSNLFTRKNLND